MPQLSNEARFALLEDAVERLAKTQEVVGENLTLLARLEERHVETREAIGRAFRAIEKCQADVNEIKLKLPQLVEARRWIVGGVLGVLSLLEIMAFNTVFGSVPVAAQPSVSAQRAATR